MDKRSSMDIVDDDVCAFLRKPNLGSLGALIGFCNTEEELKGADARALYLFQLVNILPKEDETKFNCIAVHPEGKNPCGMQMRLEVDATLKSGYRLVCDGGAVEHPHPPVEVDFWSNTLFEGNQTLRPYQVLQLLVYFFFQFPATQAHVVCEISEKDVKVWYGRFRHVMQVVTGHNFHPNGEVEADLMEDQDKKKSHDNGEEMYRDNVLKELENDSVRLLTFLVNIASTYPGLGENPMKNKWAEDCCSCDLCLS